MSQPASDPRRFPFPPAIPIIALLLSWGLGRLWPLAVSWPTWTRWAGWALFVASPVLAVAAVRTFRRHQTAVNPLGKVTMIVDSGPFRYTRNPMYLSLLVLYIGGTFAFQLPWAVALLVPVFSHHFTSSCPEEQHLKPR
jgi:protein-S-isoprenylcysteine O-methyltransferase Ste14